MSYRIYTTPGFVLGSRPHGEGGKILFIFSAELGRISAIAQGVRLSKSKLRYHAQDYSLANFSLVRGKEFWRIVGAEALAAESTESAESAPENRQKIPVIGPAYTLRVRMFSVLSRLLQGEEQNEALFASVNAAHGFLAAENDGHDLFPDRLESAEPIIMLRILRHLGYVRLVPDLAPFLSDDSFAPELFEAFAAPGIKAKAIREINTALKESHL